MKKKLKINNNIIVSSIVITLCICFIILFYRAVTNFSSAVNTFKNVFSYIHSLFRPVIMGFCFAFFLYKPVDFINDKLLIKTKGKNPKAVRAVSVLFVMLLAILLCILLIYIIIPNTVNSISVIINNTQNYISDLPKYLSKIQNNKLIAKAVSLFGFDITSTQDIYTIGEKIFTVIQKYLQNILTYSFNMAVTFGNLLYNILLGIFFALYMLLDKHTLSRQFQRVAKQIFKKHYEYLTTVCMLLDFVFFKFLTSKGLCSVIVGVMCFIASKLFNIQYALLISVIVAVTNMIPLFGPFIGAVPAVIFACLTSPMHALIMIIIIIVIQQIDSNVLAPNIIGDVVGLNGFWVMFSIIFLGKIFGVIGMIIAVPTFAVIKILVSEWLFDKENPDFKLSSVVVLKDKK